MSVRSVSWKSEIHMVQALEDIKKMQDVNALVV